MNRYIYPHFQRPPAIFEKEPAPLVLGGRWRRNAVEADQPMLGLVWIDIMPIGDVLALREVDGADPNYTQVMMVEHFRALYEPI